MTQDEVRALQRGHGIEVRINAEDPAGGKFLPSPGHDHRARRRPTASASASTAATRRGDEVSQYYDNLVGKLIVWGKDRADGDRPHDPGPRGDARRGRRHDDPGRPGHPAPPRLRRRRALDEVGRGDASTCQRRRRAGAAPPPADRRRRAPSRWCERAHDGRGQRQALRRDLWVPESAGVAGRRRPAAAKARASRGASPAGGGGGGAPAAATSPCRCRARSSRCSSRSARTVEVGQARRRARGDEDGEPDRRREGRHGQGDQGRRPATPSAAATSSPSSTDPRLRPISGDRSRPDAPSRRDGATRRLRRGPRLSAGCTSRLSTMSVTLRLAVTARAMTRDQLGGVAADDRAAEHDAGGRVGDDLDEAARVVVDQRLRAGRERHLGDADLAADGERLGLGQADVGDLGLGEDGRGRLVVVEVAVRRGCAGPSARSATLRPCIAATDDSGSLPLTSPAA